MSLRHFLARPMLAAHLLARSVMGPHSGLRILLLHDIPPGEMAAFDALVGWLTASGRLIDPSTAAEYLGGRATASAPVLLTFDDGFASNLAAATTVLARHHAKAVFFVCPGLVDLAPDVQRAAIAENIFDGQRQAADLPDALRLMTWPEIAFLHGQGHAIGNHTLSHRRLTLLSDAELEAEIAGGAEAVRRHLGIEAEWFAFPFGDISSVNARVLAAAGRRHNFVRSGIRGLNPPGTNRHAMLADHVDLGAPTAYWQLVTEGGLDHRYAEARRRLRAMMTA
jgi:peptidoglycan/xylan/chitin deacetylase (PgdA/CDA1 family)